MLFRDNFVLFFYMLILSYIQCHFTKIQQILCFYEMKLRILR